MELCLYMQIPSNNSTTVIVITCIFFVAAFFMLFYIMLFIERKKRFIDEKQTMEQAFQQQLLQSQIETQEETFSALGKELHDNIGQLLNSTKLLIGITQRTLKDYPDTLTTADETLGTAIQELRSLSKSMNKEWLQQFNLVENLETEVKRINAADGMELHFRYEGNLPFKSDEQIILFRIVQEALQNAIKHANAKHVYIELSENVDAKLFIVSVRDDGQGLRRDNMPTTGLGMINMQHRVKLLGGVVEWNSSADGTTVKIQLPIQNTTHD